MQPSRNALRIRPAGPWAMTGTPPCGSRPSCPAPTTNRLTSSSGRGSTVEVKWYGLFPREARILSYRTGSMPTMLIVGELSLLLFVFNLAHLGLQVLQELVRAGVGGLQLLELVLQLLVRGDFAQLLHRFGLCLDLVDLLRHAVEGIERRVAREGAHGLLDLLLRFRALGP